MRTLLSLVIGMIAISPAFARDLSGRWGIGAGIGPAIPVGGSTFKDFASTGFGAGGWVRNHFSPDWGFEASYDHLGFSNVITEAHAFNVSLLWRLSPLEDLSPVLGAGGGFATVPGFPGFTGGSNVDAQLSLKLRGGLEYMFADNLSFGGYLQYFGIVGKTTNSVHVIEPTVALTFYFPGGEPAPKRAETPPPTPAATPAPAPKPVVVATIIDSDGDGVPDTDDKCPGTPKGTPVNEYGCAKEEKASIRLAIEFPSGKAVIPAQYHDEVANLAAFMRKFPKTTVEIAGHTDNKGKAKTNLKLSTLRAEAIKDELVRYYAIKPERIVAKGYGSSVPLAANTTEEGRQINRRVVAEISTTTTTQ